MYFKYSEMDESFDRFLLLLAKRLANHSNYFHIQSGDATNKDTRNFVLVLYQNEAQVAELALVEYRISVEDYRHCSSREGNIEMLKQCLPVGNEQPLNTKHYLILANDREKISETDVEVVDQKTLHVEDLSIYSRKLFSVLHAARVDRKFGSQNIYEFLITQENSETTLKQLLLNPSPEQSIPQEPYYPLTPIVKNAMSLMELYEDSRGSQLGVFLIREAHNCALITHVQPVRQLDDVIASTRFIASDTIAFGDLCRRLPTAGCHEVIFREDYGMVYWQRSSGPTDALRPFLSWEGPDDFERCVAPASWLNVIYAERTSGKSEFLRFLEREFRKVKPSGWVRLVDGADISEISGLSVMQGLRKIYGATTSHEFEALEISLRGKEEVLLLIDDVDHTGDLIVKFLKEVENFEGAVKVWVAAGPATRVAIESSFPIVSHELPVMDESNQAAFLRKKLPNTNSNQVEQLLDSARKENIWDPEERSIKHPFTGNAFSLQLLVEVGLAADQSKYEPDLLEEFVKKYCPVDRLEELESRCYETIVNGHFDPEVKQLCRHSAIVEYQAAKYLVNHLQFVSLGLFRNHKLLGNIFDRILTRNCKLARFVLNKDIDKVRVSLDQYKESKDALQRTPLHLCHEALSVAEALVTSTDIDLESKCLLSDYTPLQMADERMDWKLVNLLMERGASSNFTNLRLRTMSPPELVKIIDDCISYNLLDLTRWILTNRPDLQIKQSTIYAISVCEEFDQHLAFRILELAYDQDLPSREAPYRYMWGCTALHQAAYNNNLEMCRFLVEKLRFNVDAEDYSGQTALEEASDVSVVEYLRSKSSKKVCKEIEEMKTNESEDELPETQETVFFKACYSDNLDLVRYAVESEGHDPLKQERGTYGLIRAAAWGSLPIVQYLYEAGFRDCLDLEDDSAYTALATAVRFEHLQVVKFLVEKGANTEMIRDTPINQELLKYMMDSFGFKPAVNFEALAQLPLNELREAQFDHCTKDEYGKIFLHYYVEYHNDPEILRFLLTKFNDIDIECEETGRTALHEALISHHPELVDVLLQAGADYRKRCSKTGRSVLHFAAGAHDRRHLDMFLAKPDLTIDDRNNDGETIVFYLTTGSADLIRYLVEHYKLDVNAQNNLGHTKVHRTVIEQNYFYLQDLEHLLRVVGANQNITDRRGRLALHYAVEKNDINAVRLLNRYGFLEVHLKDEAGKSSWMLAEELNRPEILEYFKNL
ncbi:uncharacterized protein LOC134209592 [Armigeres subalbatus]|uniref:uncharacterized protein LOC134209592 n=1 Tax=Armigeres subalbatus TaxID=124917 RepID=UPI002ED44068